MRTEKELQAALIKDFESGRRINFSLDPCSTMTIVGALQLALRHPQFALSMGAAPLVREFIRSVFEQATPAMREAITLGEDPANDRPLTR